MTEDRTLMKTADIVPVTSFDSEFRAWVAIARDPDSSPAQHPVDELLAEHHIMDAALAAMERETRRLSVHHDLRPDAWQDVVDFMGNYVYQVHRRKEEQGLFIAYRVAVGDALDSTKTVDIIADEHSQATNMTIDLVNGVSEGDWEKVLRAAHRYLRVARDHLIREERDVFEAARGALGPAAVDALRVRFAELETFGLGERDRMYYLELARRMCARADLDDILND